MLQFAAHRNCVMQDYHHLDVWQRAMDYTVNLYRFSAQLPVTERYNPSTQLRRAATSVPAISLKAPAAPPTGEFARFLGYSYRSLKEVVTCL